MKKFSSTIFLFAVMFFFAFSVAAAAPALFFDPPTGIFMEGDTFTATVRVSTDGASINAAEGELSYDALVAEVVQISSANSVFTYWTERPDFSNAEGRIRFAGGATNAYVGQGGEIFHVTFAARRTGEARIRFRSGALLAADGRGTNIVEQLRGGTYTIIPRGEEPSAEGYIPAGGTPAAPVIVSPTHPDPQTWYANNAPRFEWGIGSDVERVRLLVSQRPDSIPSVTYASPITSHQPRDLDDGIWYLHLQLGNANGWGRIARYEFRVDTRRPEMLVVEAMERDDPAEPRIALRIRAEDRTSGIAYYEVRAEERPPVRWEDDGSGVYVTDPLPPGDHALAVRAYDHADNWITETVLVSVAPLPAPVISEYPQRLEDDRILTVRGTAFPFARVVLYIQQEGGDVQEHAVSADRNGMFVYISSGKLADGVHSLRAQAFDERGARSEFTDPLYVAVRDPLVIRLGTRAVNVLSILVPLLGLLIALVFMVWYAWHKFHAFRKKLRGELRAAEDVLHVRFEMLKRDMKEHMDHLHKIKASRALTEEEERFMKKFMKHLSEGERVVDAELRDMENEM